MTPAEYGQRVRDRVGDAPVFLSFDIDVIDPCLAPGTGTPEAAGLLPYQALRVRAGARRARRSSASTSSRCRRSWTVRAGRRRCSPPTSPTSSSASICFVTSSLR